MAVDLIIKATGILCQKELDLQSILKKTKLRFGGYTPFFLLTDDSADNVGMLYNPQRMARGIYFDGTLMNEGQVTMSFNLPTTPSEISDVIRLATEIKVQYRNVELTCEGITVNIDDFVQNKAHYLEYSLATLRGFCESRTYEAAILTLVAFPYTLTPDEMVYYEKEGTLEEFEELIHKKQMTDLYYAVPKILTKEETGEVCAFYTVAEESSGIYPTDASCFLSANQVKIQKGYVRFYIDSTRKVMDGYYNYNNFAKVMIEWGADFFDGDHFIIPEFSIDEITEIINTIKEMPDDDPITDDLNFPVH